MSSIVPGGSVPPLPPRAAAVRQTGIGGSEMEAERDADGRHLAADRRVHADDEQPTGEDPPQPRRRSHDPSGQCGGRLDLDC
jgi:hypothetical protein